jgi:hypothetical protein
MEHHKDSQDPTLTSDNDLTVPTTGSEGPDDVTDDMDNEARAHQSVPPPHGNNQPDEPSVDLDN